MIWGSPHEQSGIKLISVVLCRIKFKKNVSSNLRQKYNNAGSNQYLCGNTRRYIFTTLSVLPLDILTRFLLPFSLHASVAFCVVDLISIIIWMQFSLHKQCPVAMIIHFSIILTTTWNWNSTPKADCSEPNSRLISEQQQNTSQWRFSVYVIRSRFISGILAVHFVKVWTWLCDEHESHLNLHELTWKETWRRRGTKMSGCRRLQIDWVDLPDDDTMRQTWGHRLIVEIFGFFSATVFKTAIMSVRSVSIPIPFGICTDN